MAQASTMNFSEAVAISASSLWAHKLRSVLTLIGVVIGVAAVIAVVSLINGANQYVATRVFRLAPMSLASRSSLPSSLTLTTGSNFRNASALLTTTMKPCVISANPAKKSAPRWAAASK
jgi:ABC-type antimicrobial peptide transport system permease subunit